MATDRRFDWNVQVNARPNLVDVGIVQVDTDGYDTISDIQRYHDHWADTAMLADHGVSTDAETIRLRDIFLKAIDYKEETAVV